MRSLGVNNGKQAWFLRHGKPDFDYENCSYDEFIEMLSNGLHVPLKEGHGIDFTKFPPHINLICHSPYRRAVETAEQLKMHLNVDKVELLPLLHEVKFDKTIIKEKEFTSIENIREPLLTRWFNNQNEAESFEDSLARVKQIELFLHNRPEKNILLVTHGWFLRLLDIYFVQGKRKAITLSDLLEAEPLDLGEFFTANIISEQEVR